MLNILDKLIGLWETGEKEWRGMLAMRIDRVEKANVMSDKIKVVLGFDFMELT